MDILIAPTAVIVFAWESIGSFINGGLPVASLSILCLLLAVRIAYTNWVSVRMSQF